MRLIVVLVCMYFLLQSPFSLSAMEGILEPNRKQEIFDLPSSGSVPHSPDRKQKKYPVNLSEAGAREWDPFLLPDRKQEGGDDQKSRRWNLSGIIYGNNQGVAIINGKIFREGDRIEGVVVNEINKDRVIFNDHGRWFELKVKRFTIH